MSMCNAAFHEEMIEDSTEVMPINMDSKIVMDKYVQCQCCTDHSRTP